MTNYRKKPLIVQAEQWYPDKPVDDVLFPAFHMTGSLPADHYSMNHCGILSSPDGDREWAGYSWQPPIGKMTHFKYFKVNPGDWIVTERSGKQYPLSPDEFEILYELVEVRI